MFRPFSLCLGRWFSSVPLNCPGKEFSSSKKFQGHCMFRLPITVFSSDCSIPLKLISRTLEKADIARKDETQSLDFMFLNYENIL